MNQRLLATSWFLVTSSAALLPEIVPVTSPLLGACTEAMKRKRRKSTEYHRRSGRVGLVRLRLAAAKGGAGDADETGAGCPCRRRGVPRASPCKLKLSAMKFISPLSCFSPFGVST